MKLLDVIHYIGKPLSFDGLCSLLIDNNINIQDEIVIPKDEYSINVDRISEGYSLIFNDEADFLGIANQAIGVGEPYLTGFFVYSSYKDGYGSYSGELPFSLSVNHSRDDICSVLGDPNIKNSKETGKKFDKWQFDNGHVLYVAYYNEYKNISFMSYFVESAKV
jgi:hypothetical protein